MIKIEDKPTFTPKPLNPSRGLIPLSHRSKEEQKAICSKGGKKSAEVRSQKKTFNELVQAICELSVNEDGRKYLESLGITDKTNKAMIVAKMIEGAKLGDDKKATWVRDTGGEKPSDKTVNVDLTYEQYIKDIEDEDEY